MNTTIFLPNYLQTRHEEIVLNVLIVVVIGFIGHRGSYNIIILFPHSQSLKFMEMALREKLAQLSL